MNAIYIINGISSLFISIILIYFLLARPKQNSVRVAFRYLWILCVLHFILAILFIFWFFNVLEFNIEDYVLIKGFFIIIEASILFFLLYKLYNKKYMLY